MASLTVMAFHHLKLNIPQMFLILATVNLIVAVYIYSLVPEFTLRFLSWCLVHLMYRLKVHGEFNIPKEGPVVLVCNHVSYIDWLIISGSCKRPIRFVMYYKLTKLPLLKYLIKQAKVIPIASAKEDPQLMEEAFTRISKELAEGEIVCIFPEGSLTKTGELSHFRPGIERIISTNPVSVVPMALKGLWGSFFSQKDRPALKKLPRRFWHRVSLEIGAPVAPQNVQAASLESHIKRMIA